MKRGRKGVLLVTDPACSRVGIYQLSPTAAVRNPVNGAATRHAWA